MLKNQPLTVMTRVLDSHVQRYVINNLAATTLYTVEVFASTQAGPGPARRADIESGIPPGENLNYKD